MLVDMIWEAREGCFISKTPEQDHEQDFELSNFKKGCQTG